MFAFITLTHDVRAITNELFPSVHNSIEASTFCPRSFEASMFVREASEYYAASTFVREAWLHSLFAKPLFLYLSFVFALKVLFLPRPYGVMASLELQFCDWSHCVSK